MSAVTPALASDGASMDASILSWMNADRSAQGLRPFRLDSRIVALADERAAALAASGVLSHDTGTGTVCDELSPRRIVWYFCAEDIGTSNAAWGAAAAAHLYSMWKASPGHWAEIMSASSNYVGVGVAQRPDGSTWASIVFLEGPDRTTPIAKVVSRSRAGTAIHFRWEGQDPVLQTHTAGLRDFNVRYRVDGRSWRTIRTATRATGITLSGRAHRHAYWISIQADDRRGNLSAWSAPVRIWVP